MRPSTPLRPPTDRSEEPDNDAVLALVYAGAFAPEHGESASDLAGRFPGSTLGDAIVSSPVPTGGNEFRIRAGVFHQQFVADGSAAEAELMAVTQRPVTEAALTEGLRPAAMAAVAEPGSQPGMAPGSTA